MVILAAVRSYWKTSVRPAIGLLVQRGPSDNARPDPSEYTTLAAPMEVPVQREAYFLALNEHVRDGDEVLDVGCGLGYGLNILSIRAGAVEGVDVDQRAIDHCHRALMGRNPKLRGLQTYDGKRLPYADDAFDVVTTIDVIEHVPDYDAFLRELCRVTRRNVVVSTPNRRPEFTNADGSPKNHWHLREWTRPELSEILAHHPVNVLWSHVDGPWEGPHTVSHEVGDDTQTLTPVLALR